MFKASDGIILPTSIIGSLPRPAWFTASIGLRSFLECMVDSRFREQYEDAVGSHLRDQELAGLEALVPGAARDGRDVRRGKTLEEGVFRKQGLEVLHGSSVSRPARASRPGGRGPLR